MGKHIQKFLYLKAAGDIINACFPILNSEKEITETMAIIQHLRKIILDDEKNKYTIYDFCAGNALTSVTSAFLLPIKKAIAFDIKERERRWHLVNKFEYRQKDDGDIYKFNINEIDENSIIIGIHPCCDLSKKIIEIYNNSKAKYLILMPCCYGQINPGFTYSDDFLKRMGGEFNLWCIELVSLCKGKKLVTLDKGCLSEKNIIIKAKKND